MKTLIKRRNFWILIAIIILFWIYSIFTFLSLRDDNYFGEIKELTPTSLIINDKRDGAIIIGYDVKTPIFSDLKDEKKLEVGKHVFISTKKTSSGEIKAKFIRMLKPKKQK